MEVPGGQQNKLFVCYYELIGTALFMIALNWGKDDLALSVTLVNLIILFGQVSGGHYNPAITLAVYIKEKEGHLGKLGFFALIVFSQICGAWIGVSLSVPGLFTGPAPN